MHPYSSPYIVPPKYRLHNPFPPFPTKNQTASKDLELGIRKQVVNRDKPPNSDNFYFPRNPEP